MTGNDLIGILSLHRSQYRENFFTCANNEGAARVKGAARRHFAQIRWRTRDTSHLATGSMQREFLHQ
jgi:hypothetical protein